MLINRKFISGSFNTIEVGVNLIVRKRQLPIGRFKKEVELCSPYKVIITNFDGYVVLGMRSGEVEVDDAIAEGQRGKFY